MAREKSRTLQCTECKNKNYTSMKNKKTSTEQAGDEEILSFLPQASSAQGD